MTDLLSPEQILARARDRRERISTSQNDRGGSTMPIIVEGWSGDRQAFGFAVTDSDALVGVVSIARSALNVDRVVVFSDARGLAPDAGDPKDRALEARYFDGEITLADLARLGHPGVIEQLMIVSADLERGPFDAQQSRYLTRFAFGREVGLVWDLEDEGLMDDIDVLSGKIPDGLKWAMVDYGISAEGAAFPIRSGGALMWEALDPILLSRLAVTLDEVSRGIFVIMNFDPKISDIVGLKPGSAPGRIAIGNREPEVIVQLVAREQKSASA